MGSPGTSGDLSRDQAEKVLLEKDYVVSPLQDTERFQNLCNIKEHQCMICQIADNKGEPIWSPLPYALLLNNCVMATTWCITGEFSDNNIFHTHAVLKTGARSDSLRRSLAHTWDHLMGASNFVDIVGQGATMDIIKLQRCQKWSGMMGYMMKDPLWVISNCDRTLQCAYDIDKWELNKRFKGRDDPKTAPDMNAMSKEIVDLIITNGCKTFQDCIKCAPEVMSKYLHKPGLQTIVTNCLEFVKSSGAAWNITLYEVYEPQPNKIHMILLHQGINPTAFDEIFYKWITKQDSKRNTICLQGPSNTGKSAFLHGLKQIINWGEIVNGQTFAFEGLVDACIGVWEEPLCSSELAEKAKQVLEGMVTSIPVKYKKPMKLPRTPIFITTNHTLWRFCSQEEQMFRNRMWIFDWLHECKDTLLVYRTSNDRCKCAYCRASCSSESFISESSFSGVPGTEQPVCTEQLVWPLEGGNVGSGPMPGTSGSTAWSYDSTPGSSGSGSDSQRSDISKPGSSSSSANVRHMGAFRILRPSDTECRLTEPKSAIVLESYPSRRDTVSVRGRHKPTILKRRRGDDHGYAMPQCDSSRVLGSDTQNTETQKTFETSTKKQRVDRTLGSVTLNTDITEMLSIPSKQDWQSYLSFLYHIYG